MGFIYLGSCHLSYLIRNSASKYSQSILLVIVFHCIWVLWLLHYWDKRKTTDIWTLWFQFHVRNGFNRSNFIEVYYMNFHDLYVTSTYEGCGNVSSLPPPSIENFALKWSQSVEFKLLWVEYGRTWALWPHLSSDTNVSFGHFISEELQTDVVNTINWNHVGLQIWIERRSSIFPSGLQFQLGRNESLYKSVDSSQYNWTLSDNEDVIQWKFVILS